jgi:hypothetical protein
MRLRTRSLNQQLKAAQARIAALEAAAAAAPTGTDTNATRSLPAAGAETATLPLSTTAPTE